MTVTTEQFEKLLQEYRTTHGDEAVRQVFANAGLRVVPSLPARPTGQGPATHLVKVYVPGAGGGDYGSKTYTVCARWSAEVAEDYCRTAQEAADRFYSTDDIPADWEYEQEDWLDDKLQPLSQQHDEEIEYRCGVKGIPTHHSQEGYDCDRHAEVQESAAAVVGCHINPCDPKMWYRCGMQRPHYFVEEVPS